MMFLSLIIRQKTFRVTSPTPKIIISDTSCFIVLSKIGELGLLQKLYIRLATTTTIASEFGEELPEWVDVISVKDVTRQQLLELQLDQGESSAIALALEIPDSTLILDDAKARNIALRLGLKITGTIGVIIKAKHEGVIPAVKPLIEKIKHAGFRLSEDLEKQALILAAE